MYRSEIDRIAGLKDDKPEELPVVAYCRVSSHEQKSKGDLERQQGRVFNYCIEKGYRVLKSYAEVGSGMNDNRPILRALFRLVIAKQINDLFPLHLLLKVRSNVFNPLRNNIKICQQASQY